MTTYLNKNEFVDELEKTHIYSTDFSITYNDGETMEYTLFDGTVFHNHNEVGWNIFQNSTKATICGKMKYIFR